METLLKADVFFTITSVAVVLIALAAIIALVYVVLILNELRQLMRRIRQEGEHLVNDIAGIREAVEHQGWRTKEFVDSLGHGALALMKIFGSRDSRDDSKTKK